MYVLDVFVAGPTLAPDPEEKTAKPASEGQILTLPELCKCQDLPRYARRR